MKTKDRFPNRHTERCTGCGATPGQPHVDCRGHLGTGIRNHRAARRDLRRRFSQGQFEVPTARVGARFYVGAISGRRYAYLAGPYASHMAALAAVPRVRAELARYAWLNIGTCSLPATVPTALGRP